MKFLFGRSDRYRCIPRGEFYCPGCRQTAVCLGMDTLTVTRVLGVPVHRRSKDSGLVKCGICGGVFDRDVTAFSPTVSREGLKPALLAVLLAMLSADMEGENAEACVEVAVVSSIVAEVTGEAADPEALRNEARHLKDDPGALDQRLKVITPYLTNAEKRMLLESALRVAHANGDASEMEMALIQRIAGLLDVSDALFRGVTEAGLESAG
ncbi:co-chaperone djla n-terminal [Desulfoluna spongiiphila]|nr:co-chaperone djla n-terminal [Desulfoluna spongiiphila]